MTSMKSISYIGLALLSQVVNPVQFEDPSVAPNFNRAYVIELQTSVPESCVEAELHGATFVIESARLPKLAKELDGFAANGAAAFAEAGQKKGMFCERVIAIKQYSPDTNFIIESLRRKEALLFRKSSATPETKAVIQFVSGASAGDVVLRLAGSQCVLARAMWWVA